MATGSLPVKDAALLAYGQNFSSRVANTPILFGISAEQVSSLGANLSSFMSTLQTATTPATRTKISIEAKNAAKKSLVTDLRYLAKVVDGQSSVTDEMRLELGLNIRKKPSPKPVPDLAPRLNPVMRQGTTITLTIRGDEDKRARPQYVAGTNLFSYVGENPPADPSLWRYQGQYSKMTADITFPLDTVPGTKVWFVGYFYNAKGESGPGCTPVPALIAGGGMAKVAA